MTDERRLYRSRDALVGGVCAGIADYFNVDPLVTRILTIVCTLASGGLLALAYVALWIIVPKEPETFVPFDVEPEAVHSDTYGAVECGASRGDGASHAARPVTPATMAGWRYTTPDYPGSGHTPPEPPAAVSWSSPVPPAPRGAGGVQPQQPQQQPGCPWMSAPPWTGYSAPAGPSVPPCRTPSSAKVKAALIIGSILLFFGIGMLVSEFAVGVSWWQCWPLVLVILGIVRMVLPDAAGWNLSGFSRGLVLFAVGATLLPMSLNIVAWRTIVSMVVSLWPMLCIAVGFLVLSCALKSSGLKLAAALCFVGFCAAGLLWCSMPGSAEGIVLMTPYGREYRFLFFA